MPVYNAKRAVSGQMPYSEESDAVYIFCVYCLQRSFFEQKLYKAINELTFLQGS